MGAAPYALSPDLSIMPQYLTRLGYEARAVGKWHLGSHTASVTPTHRYKSEDIFLFSVSLNLCSEDSSRMLDTGLATRTTMTTLPRNYTDP